MDPLNSIHDLKNVKSFYSVARVTAPVPRGPDRWCRGGQQRQRAVDAVHGEHACLLGGAAWLSSGDSKPTHAHILKKCQKYQFSYRLPTFKMLAKNSHFQGYFGAKHNTAAGQISLETADCRSLPDGVFWGVWASPSRSTVFCEKPVGSTITHGSSLKMS